MALRDMFHPIPQIRSVGTETAKFLIAALALAGVIMLLHYNIYRESAISDLETQQRANVELSAQSPQSAMAAVGVDFLRQHWPMYALLLAFAFGWSMMLGFQCGRATLALSQRDRERHFRYILQDINLFAVSLDERGVVTYCNDYLLEMSGRSLEEVIGSDWFELFVPTENRDTERNLVLSVTRPDAPPLAYCGTMLARDDGVCFVDWNATPTDEVAGGSMGLTLIGKDVTEQRRAEEQLRKLSRAVEQSPNTVMIANTDAEIEYVNPKFTELTGYSADEVIGKNPRILKSGETSEREYEELWKTITEGGEWRGEFHNRKKNGELYWEATAISAIRDAEGNITHFLAVKEDLTERKRLEEEAERRKREAARNRELAVVGRMANMIAHDLRNPMSSVKMALQIVDRGQHEEQTQELIQISLNQVRYMEEILTDLLSYSRPDALRPEWLSVDKLLDTAVSISQREINRRGVLVETQFQSGLPTLHGDRTRLVQALSNLIVNAVQATEQVVDRTPEIAIEASLQLSDTGTAIKIEISDNGCGFDSRMGDQLYEPFFTTRAKGTGLGLAIVKRIISQHNGFIVLEARKPYGTRAIAVLPTGPVPVAAAVEAEVAPRVAAS